eukprot:195115_1
MANKRLKSLQKLQQFDAQLGPEFQNDYKAMHDKVLSLIPLYTKSVQLCLEQQNQIKDLQTEINESKAHFHTLARHAADEKEKANAQIHEANAQIEKLLTEITKLKSNYQRLQNTHNTLQNTHNTLQNTHN